MGAEEPWFVSGFRAGYLDLYPHRDLESARAEVNWLLGQGVRGRVLDLCCGYGRHALALHERGIDVFGMDLSADLLEHALREPGYEPIRKRLVRGDARALPFQAASFDTVLNLFSSFGYFGTGGDREVLKGIARILRPGGLLVLDLMNPARIRSNLVPRSESRRGGGLLIEERSLSPDGLTVCKQVEHHRTEGVRRWREEVRMYEPSELDSLLLGANIEPLVRVGDFSGAAFGPAAERQLVLARRR